MAFSSKSMSNAPDRSIRYSDGQDKQKGTVIDQIEGLFTSQITGLDIQKNRLGTEMRMALRTRDLLRMIEPLKPDSAIEGEFFDTDAQAFLRTLVSLLQTNETEHQYRLDLIMNTGDSPAQMAQSNPDMLQDYSRQITEIASILNAGGLQDRFLSIGFRGGQPGWVYLYFRRQTGLRFVTVNGER